MLKGNNERMKLAIVAHAWTPFIQGLRKIN